MIPSICIPVAHLLEVLLQDPSHAHLLIASYSSPPSPLLCDACSALHPSSLSDLQLPRPRLTFCPRARLNFSSNRGLAEACKTLHRPACLSPSPTTLGIVHFLNTTTLPNHSPCWEPRRLISSPRTTMALGSLSLLPCSVPGWFASTLQDFTFGYATARGVRMIQSFRLVQ